MGYEIGQPIVWPCVPDWSNPVVESLAWSSDVMQATATAVQQVRQLRAAPRRGFSWQSKIARDDRRIVDSIRRQIGVKQFVLPIFHDAQWLSAALDAGALSVACDTAGFDFVVGGRVLFWRDAQHWELLTLDSVDAAALNFTAATANAWGPGDRLYPVRTARLAQAPQETQWNDETSALQVQALIDEPCDWPAAWPSATVYRGMSVMDWRGDESEDPTDQFNRYSGSIDADTGPVFYYDMPGQPFRLQSQRFNLWGRSSHNTFRALAYQLAGRAAQCWVPDWQSSVRLSAPVAAGANQLTIAWQGYTQFDYQQPGRRDLRIELYDGTALYRRITGSADAVDHEVLQIDSALGVAVDPAAIRQINLMAVCASATDVLQIQHDTDDDGVGSATINWQAVANNV